VESLTGAQRKYLRGLAHGLRPVVMVGRQGVSPELLKAVDEALESHELIKVKFVEFKEERRELSSEIAAGTQSELAGLIGNVAIFYRPHPREDKRKITLP
jgi:RNA-binding protein